MQTSMDLAGVIRNELLTAIDSAPVLGPKDLYVESLLDKMFLNYDWAKTFSSPVAIVYDEIVTSEILLILHQWLRRQCANIENIYLITTHHSGVKLWWDQWCECFHEKSFNIVETFFTNAAASEKYFKNIDFDRLMTSEFYRLHKTVNKLFSFYGGTYSSMEREFLTLKMLEFYNVAEIDFFAQFSSKKEILDYTENITYFLNQNEIDNISRLYDQYVSDRKLNFNCHLLRNKDEAIDFSGLQWSIDKNCWATVIRETVNSDLFSTITEKTLRACLHHTVLIPIGFYSVRDLEALGFWFPHDIVDYSYQSEPLFAKRIDKLVNTLHTINKHYSAAQLEQYYVDNLHQFQYNVQLVHNYVRQKSKIKKENSLEYYKTLKGIFNA
jgi:hypothetical protein